MLQIFYIGHGKEGGAYVGVFAVIERIYKEQTQAKAFMKF